MRINPLERLKSESRQLGIFVSCLVIGWVHNMAPNCILNLKVGHEIMFFTFGLVLIFKLAF